MRTIIIGGGAGGASCAARLRRLDENMEILILEKTEETSIASCGLPYYIGGVIENRANMQVAKPALMKSLFNIDIKLNSEVTEITPQTKSVTTKNGETYTYDKLVIATGAAPFIPKIKGLDLIPNFTVKHLADADNIKTYIKEHNIKQATVVGGGFIGVEVAENLHHLGLETTLVEMLPQILPPMDEDTVCYLEQEMQKAGIKLELGDGLSEIIKGGIVLNSGKLIKTEMLILALGVRPVAAIALKAGIKLTPKGSIVTNEYMQTNVEDIYACGDNVAVTDFISQDKEMIALAGPANRQGRCIADHICGTPYPYKATQGTGIVKVFGLTGAFTGNNEKQLQAKGISYEKMLITGSSHAGYYPNAEALTLKVLYDKESGKILGAQAVGKEGVDKRIDVIATVMRLGGTTADLRDAELCYAPPYSGAKDPINMIGMAIENIRQGLVKPYFGTDFSGMTVIDVRPPEVYNAAHIENAINIPAGKIRERLNDIPKDKPIMIHCFKGYTSYVVCRILAQHGFKEIYSYAGGWSQYVIESKNKK